MREGMDMGYEHRKPNPDIELPPACFECGVRLQEQETFEVEGELLCAACAEDHIDDYDQPSQAASVEDSEPPRRSQYH